jgi:hypothetical protein|tara:strand:+ start:418 stop:666 length:249 start_codon:yes stop_codon:yes gene_type:complete
MKKILITIGVLMTMSFSAQENKTNWELYQAISDVEDYIEWLNEDLYQGDISQENYEVMLENYQETLQHLLNVHRDIAHLIEE